MSRSLWNNTKKKEKLRSILSVTQIEGCKYQDRVTRASYKRISKYQQPIYMLFATQRVYHFLTDNRAIIISLSVSMQYPHYNMWKEILIMEHQIKINASQQRLCRRPNTNYMVLLYTRSLCRASNEISCLLAKRKKPPGSSPCGLRCLLTVNCFLC